MHSWLEKLIKEQPNLFVQAIQAANDGIVITDYQKEDNPIIFVNKAFEAMSGYSYREILLKNCRFLQGNDRNQSGLEVIRKAVKEGISCRVDLRNYKKDGSMYWNELSVAPLKNNQGQITHFVGVQKDITKQKRFEESLFLQSYEDPLTHLLNRRGFEDKAQSLLTLSKSNQFNIALVIIDLDSFKAINDCYGHTKGDEVLIKVANLLKSNSRPFDVVARYGGDEFIALFAEKDSFSMKTWKMKLAENLEKINSSKELEPSISFSIGEATLPFLVDKSLEKAILEADNSLYEMKKMKMK
ncbi:MAG: diguanylate cyclase [Chlamydiota bacterium]|jgi:diguanylate cyclase (GGDEF)-like protein/PAS domain S-box-containing protein